jgi:hypothetical protein
MIIKSADSESGHWYAADGSPAYRIIGKNGKERNTTVRDARERNLVPSVTTVLGLVAKPGLNTWLQQQVLLAALTLPRIPLEAEDDYINRIMSDSKEQGKAAADAGTDIHASIQGFYEGEVVHRHEAHVKGTVAALDAVYGQQGWIAERAFGHSHGFGGKCDLHCTAGDGIVVDVKTKEFTDPNKVDAYDDHLMQLAAYRVGLGVPKARCANAFVSRSVPGLVVIKEWEEADLQRGWEMFCHLLSFWTLKHKFNM